MSSENLPGDKCYLGPVVLAPDVEHEHAGDEEEGHDQNWDWANLNSGGIISVKSPHSSTAGASCPLSSSDSS